jgi:hypothetical protein
MGIDGERDGRWKRAREMEDGEGDGIWKMARDMEDGERDGRWVERWKMGREKEDGERRKMGSNIHWWYWENKKR